MNESRLSPSGEESGPVELKSRDVLQFGVNVNVERRGRVRWEGGWRRGGGEEGTGEGVREGGREGGRCG